MGLSTYFIIYHICTAYQNNQQKGIYFSKEDSPYYKIDGSIDLLNVIGIIMRAFLQLAQFFAFYFMMKYSFMSGVSFAVIVSILSLSSLFTTLEFFIIYREKLSMKHFIGMLIMIGCVVCVTLSHEEDHYDNPDIVYTTTIWVPIACAFIGSLIFTFTALLNRYFC